MILTGVIFLTSEGTDTSGDPVDLATILRDDVENNAIYYVEDLVILDNFAEKDDIMYMSVMFRDEGGSHVVAVMPVTDDDEIWDEVNDYMNNDLLSWGDLVVSCYVETETNVNVDNKLHQYFDEWVEDYEYYTDSKVFPLEWRFDYVCDEDGDPHAIAEGANIVAKIVGVLTIAAAVAVLYFGALRKPKAYTTAPVPGYTAPQVPTYTVPNPPTYSAPQAPSYTSAQSSLNDIPQVRYSAPVPPAPQAQPVQSDAIAQLNRYKELKDAGFMTDEEFNQKRRELLGL